MNKRLLSGANKRNIQVALVCGVMLILVVFGVVIKSVSGKDAIHGVPGGIHNAPTTLTTASPSASATSNSSDLVVSSQPISPTATLTPKGGTPTSSATTPTLTSYPSSPSGSTSIYFGVHVPLDSLSDVTAFEGDAHKGVSIVMWYQQWGLTNGWQYMQSYWMNDVRSHGSIPLITWDPQDPANGSANQPAYALQNIINGNFDAYITQWAQESKAWGHPYFLRFAHEMNGYWNPWSEQVNGNKPGQFVLAWRHVHDIFTRLGVSNVTWVWSPNIDFSISTPLRELYPGDAYVDWVGMSGYNWGNIGGHVWQSFSSVFSQTYNDILGITSRPIMITETASTEQAGNKASWISDAFVTQLPHNFPRIHAFVWFNESKETDWQIESSSSAQNAFAAAISSGAYASNNFAGLNASPIPPL
jgi:hypothetical protein